MPAIFHILNVGLLSPFRRLCITEGNMYSKPFLAYIEVNACLSNKYQGNI